MTRICSGWRWPNIHEQSTPLSLESDCIWQLHHLHLPFSSYYPCLSFYSLQTNVNGWKTVLFIVVTAWLGILVACIIVLFTICSERERERAQTLSVFKMYNYSGSWCLPYVTIRGGWSTLFDFVYEHMQHYNIIYICSHSFFLFTYHYDLFVTFYIKVVLFI